MRSLLGTDLPRVNPALRPATDPYSGAPVVLVPAIVPDVAILHAQRADEEGHAHLWGTLGVTREAALAARRVILVAEEIFPATSSSATPVWCWCRPSRSPRSSTSRTGAYPSPVQGHYGRDHDCYHRYHDESRSEDGMRDWLDRWVLGVDDWNGFLAASARGAGGDPGKRARPSRPLDYGARTRSVP